MVEITDRDFSVEEIISRMAKPEVGGIITYLGTVRSFSEGGKVERVEFDADEAVVGKIRDIEKKTLKDFDVEAVAIVHRVGRLKVGDRILLVAVSAAHRQPAFAACMSIIDAIKGIHSTWQREVYRSS
ncbi:MAG TPA: molybdenum cofactor biosynthesis protein MoaE [Dehalococcoidales bacterium]|nr:molybdenum cofactor biosynthesis protein MoaE [Dehalococcoidales bacterium]